LSSLSDHFYSESAALPLRVAPEALVLVEGTTWILSAAGSAGRMLRLLVFGVPCGVRGRDE
jgi:hypothetical protein